MMELLQKSPIALDIQVTSASLGYCAVGDHDPRVEHAAQASGLSLPPRSALCFDEVDSIVNTDLVLVMDRFDFSEVSLQRFLPSACFAEVDSMMNADLVPVMDCIISQR